jgi:single-strand DNA-binding protein
MYSQSNIVIVGNVGGEVDFHVTPNGDSVCGFSVAVTSRKQENGEWVDAETTWYRVSVWKKNGSEAVAEAVSKGTRVAVGGRFKVSEFEKDGVKRSKPEITADWVGVIPKPLPKPQGARQESEDSPW